MHLSVSGDPNERWYKPVLNYFSSDRMTSGNWIGTYGTAGCIIPGHCNEIFDYPVILSDSSVYLNKEESRAILMQTGEGTKSQTCYNVDDRFFVISLIIPGDEQKRVSVYLLDWELIPILDAEIEVVYYQGNVLDKRKISKFGNGIYVTYEVLGLVTFRITYHSDIPNRTYGNQQSIDMSSGDLKDFKWFA